LPLLDDSKGDTYHLVREEGIGLDVVPIQL
jgi:hypothetical protein